MKTQTDKPTTTASASQNRAMAKDAALTGLPTLDPNDMPTPAQRRKWRNDYRKAQDGALKLIPAAKTATASAPGTRTPRNLKPGTVVEDIYTGEINTVKCAYWQAYAGGNTSDYTVEFEPTPEQPTGWNKSTNLRVISTPMQRTIPAEKPTATDADERALIPGFKRIRPQTRDEKRDAWDEQAEHNRDLEYESRETEEREATGYWDCNEEESTTD